MLALTRHWYHRSLTPLTLLLLPLAKLFAVGLATRRGMYRVGLIKTQRFRVPVIVVGNITVGGTGKTPLVIWLAKHLQANGYRPGIVSRGYGGKKHAQPYWVKANDAADAVGDEAILLVRNVDCPVVVSANRAAAVRQLLQQSDCNVVISDDGLQHYRLARDIEIAVVDGARRFGNQCLLPAGPLREPVSRLQQVDFMVVNGSDDHAEIAMTLEPLQLISLNNQQALSWSEFHERRVHAVAGIGHPERFFLTLEKMGFTVIRHVFPDHHAYQPHELDFHDALPVVMTEKDAVKCAAFAKEHYWFLKIAAKIKGDFPQKILERLPSMEVCDDVEKDFAKGACSFSRHVEHDGLSK